MRFNTTLGNIDVELWKPVQVETCGINYCDELQVRVWTDSRQRSGYIVYVNIKTGKRRYQRIRVHYISAESALKYGRKTVVETLPITTTTL
jgi:hypothetical protein